MGVCPISMGHERDDQGVCESPHVVALISVLSDGGGQCDVEIRPTSVVNTGGGVWAISIGSENVGRWE